MTDWEKALETFYKTTKDKQIDFYLIGSITAGIKGVDIVPHDMDVIQ